MRFPVTRLLRLPICAILCALPSFGGTLFLNSQALDTSRFNVTQFAIGLPGPIGAIPLGGDFIGIASYGNGIQAFPGIGSGVASGPGTTIYGAQGAYTGLIQAGNYYVAGNSGSSTASPSITFLQPGAAPNSPLTVAGTLQFSFPSIWEHSQMGIAARPTPG